MAARDGCGRPHQTFRAGAPALVGGSVAPGRERVKARQSFARSPIGDRETLVPPGPAYQPVAWK